MQVLTASLSAPRFDELETSTLTIPFGQPMTVIGAMRLGAFVGRHPPTDLTVEGTDSTTVRVETGHSLIGYTDRGTAIQSGSTIMIPPLPVRTPRNAPSITIHVPGSIDQQMTVAGDTDYVRMRIRDVKVEIGSEIKTLNPGELSLGKSSIAMSGVWSLTMELTAISCFAHAEMQLQVWTLSELDLGEPDLSGWEVA